MLFGELLEAVEVCATAGDPAVPVKGIAYDSRQVEPGFLFVAVKGFKADGHEYINEAIKNGAVAVVTQREADLPPGLAWALTPDTRLALALLAARFYGYPSSKMKMIGITGTNGKTTTTNLVAAVLSAAGQKTGLIGTIHNRIGDRILPVKHTTPESLDLQRLLADMAAEGVGTCIMEVSSHALALHRVAGCEFDVAVFTNFTQDHLDFHENMEDYLETKLGLFKSLALPGVKKQGKYAVVNIDDARAAEFIRSAGVPVYTYGIESQADVRAEGIEVSARGVNFTARGRWGSCPLKLKITGLFNVYNTLAAFAVTAALGIPANTIRDTLEATGGVAGRFELVDKGQDFAVIVDYAHTPDGLENILKTAVQITRGRLITVFGCGGDRDRTKRPLMGQIAAKYSDFVIITSDNPRTEDPLGIIDEIENGLKPAANECRYTVEPDRRKAIRAAVKAARPGDVVVIAGKGHEDYQIIGTRKFPFDDRLEAAQALEELK
ncbi:UDP-N-acetylmuramoyl-L-alanyl-D-glutamate--2,6-diaminopimelate ligase [Pelotomaculum propionicicum]|uniref:UDP-N-acetylmuramoyl-L-alanyl-D-glutamate--2,6-diaminopimelate ligase n=1 Tax=Pelotomaculum propionicicum TaxID=258475 RepID=A0A4Y7RWM0_9FIRM|nr:UDP-N-acetylmuramoyl-L-alanyl-D-glutamate--2,6-diaminopimelate ligase [Pelotomaculum propionicicum]TEB13126.1 UDP-N-acetylmuramoyl-L-alanyl-D-glutamate--2,6-diaminopimelate ligase [Pelotomaculum propionicicum]